MSPRSLIVAALLLVLLSDPTQAFAPVSATVRSATCTASSTPLSMGLFDFFMSDEEKKAREEAKQREIEEQERLQKAILERRRNPELMEAYEAKVSVRRNLRMQGKDALAEKMDLYENSEDQTLLDGTQGLK
mmetsp:Transcript_28817/g.79108  ORF Transcript_28817/g.79108 Transcript_28817/m.79108 type:complete len:132 (+) Transcript_28817:163-558(+)|eukprot:CAMPEP_0168838700 /NCGR_PEP_ID=MMETSP0727-20121128/5775_1 /TAXON_ID=265536 /ORGANISM="Amphiprora sp., Strain CCMP467" /LENGTH=131 /DNA_ID=CAMNT_0008892157 /DNA_START=57 /DNA_END=452 /DNA_ORIENTATION=-